MPNWNEVLIELQRCKDANPLDFVRRKYLKKLHEKTGRNVISYYSGWLQRPNIDSTINDNDKNGFMTAIYGMDKSLENNWPRLFIN